ncbi:ABC transporter substrate-binding protein [Kytococcus sp. Marseille-QA3725]
MRRAGLTAIVAVCAVSVAACDGGEEPRDPGSSSAPTSDRAAPTSSSAEDPTGGASPRGSATEDPTGSPDPTGASSDGATGTGPSGTGPSGSGSSDSGRSAPDGQESDPTEEPDPTPEGLDPEAQGPAPDVEGAEPGGTLHVLSTARPSTFDPSGQHEPGLDAILDLTVRRLTQYRTTPDGTSELVPDLATDLGTVSEDGLTWTFTLKDDLRYEDGSDVTAEDVAYGIKRSFVGDELPGEPTHQREFLEGGDSYDGPFEDGGDFAGVEVVDDRTLEIHLDRPWPSLPHFAATTQMSPVPQDKDTRERYGPNPMATGPYEFKYFDKRKRLVLEKNDQWDPTTDPGRHQYPDTIEFEFGGDPEDLAGRVGRSEGDDRTALYHDGLADGVPEELRDEEDRLVTGPGPCVSFVSMDTRTIPIEVRRAIAVAWPYNQERAARGTSERTARPATSYLRDSAPGFDPESSPLLPGQGPGTPETARGMLDAVGQRGFELSWYYAHDREGADEVNEARREALEAAGFTVRTIGVPADRLEEFTTAHDAEANLLLGPSQWCPDWPGGDAVYPRLFDSGAREERDSVGHLASEGLDEEMDRIQELPMEEQAEEWARFDRRLRDHHLPALPVDQQQVTAAFGTEVHEVRIDPVRGTPDLTTVWVGGD